MSQTRTARIRRVRLTEKNETGSTLVQAASLLINLIRTTARWAMNTSQTPSVGMTPRAQATPIISPTVASVLPTLVPPINASSSSRQLVAISAGPQSSIEHEFTSIAADAPVVASAAQPRIIQLAQAALQAPPASTNSEKALQELRSYMIREHQTVVVEKTFAIVSQSLSEISFAPVLLKPDCGYILARQGDQGPQIRADVIRVPDGTVSVVFDADCFIGSTCEDALQQLEARIRENGVDLQPLARKPKRRNQYVAARIAMRRAG
jgi:hypothetical protein